MVMVNLLVIQVCAFIMLSPAQIQEMVRSNSLEISSLWCYDFRERKYMLMWGREEVSTGLDVSP